MSVWVAVVLLGGYVVLSAITFGVYGWDKAAARAAATRVPESMLHVLALAGGWPGALFAQRVFRHKTRKHSFRSVFWCTVAANVVVVLWLVVSLA